MNLVCDVDKRGLPITAEVVVWIPKVARKVAYVRIQDEFHGAMGGNSKIIDEWLIFFLHEMSILQFPG